jgi:uncharacterized membrane protein YeaQ/YmgE (transglycosylase-associated protein family)
MIVIAVIDLVLGALIGWLVPEMLNSDRPYGTGGDVGASAVSAVGLGIVEWSWILPALGFSSGWIKVAAAIGDPLGLALIVLWLIRKIKG